LFYRLSNDLGTDVDWVSVDIVERGSDVDVEGNRCDGVQQKPY
jgi:hypothetical protein